MDNDAKEAIGRAIHRLDSIDATDPERAHAEADDALFELVDPDVRMAYLRLMERANWWASA